VKLGKEKRGIDRYFQAITTIQNEAVETQYEKLEKIAEKMVQTIINDGRIFLFGTGHSHMLAEEGFFRAGGLAQAVPIFSSALMLHEKPAFSSHLERTAGIVEKLLNIYKPEPGEMIFIFSNSGVNRLPVELAMLAKERGLFVVTISSFTYSQEASLSTLGKRINEVADIALDNKGVSGDALYKIDGTHWRVGSSSTIIGALFWNCLLAECAERLRNKGYELPVFASFNMPGAEDHNKGLLEKWQGLNPHL
jgi:uncharacterized phosphosugar-binding protein